MRYKGAIISATAPTVTASQASGAWTLQQQYQYQGANTWPFGGPFNYIEDVFSTYLYTGNGSTQTITNGIDLSGKGGLTWFKDRTTAQSHMLIDSVRGTNKALFSNETRAQATESWSVTYNSNGMTLPGSAADPTNGIVNFNGYVMASWTFRKQPKFFDIVTYTGNGASQNISHNLGSVPGCIIVKCTNTARAWAVYHRSLGNASAVTLNDTTASRAFSGWNNTDPTSTVFSVGADSDVNGSGNTYVAYLFAHNAGGFGATGADNVISCGSFTTDSVGSATATLGYEPQWLLFKQTSGTGGSWLMYDNMRGMPVTTGAAQLNANTAGAEGAIGGNVSPTATGFTTSGQLNSSATFIYIAIRRPMKTPTVGTSVYKGSYGDNDGVAPAFSSVGFPVDLAILAKGATGTTLNRWGTRLTQSYYLDSSSAAAEASGTAFMFDYQDGWANATSNFTSAFSWMFRRAPGFFDVVCYTGTGVARTINHNLGVVPELMIVKRRDNTSYGDWLVYSATLGNTKYLLLNTTQASTTANSGAWNFTNPTATQFTVGDWESVSSTATYVAYLFASCPNVSTVGSYTGTGALQTINCGFTSGARFVLIKRTDATGDWWVYDSARGISSGNDPYLFLNSTAAEVTGTNYVDTTNVGFQVTAAAPAGLNANGGTYIFLAIA